MAGVCDLGTASEAFPERNGTKQSRVMAQLLICIIFSAMLHDAFRNCNSGVMIRLRSNGGLFNLQHLKAWTKVSLLLLRELLCRWLSTDCSQWGRDTEHPQWLCESSITLWPHISITKAEVMPQPKLGSSPRDPVIKIGGKQLLRRKVINLKQFKP